MALTAQSLFLYNYQVTATNRNIDFQVVSAEPVRTAKMNLGFYSLASLLVEVERAMTAVATSFTFTAAADRTISGGTQNRVTISTSSTFFSILFATGPNSTASAASLLGFTGTDQTGHTTYTGTLSTGTALLTTFQLGGFSYLPTDNYQKVFGSVNVSASGDKEAIVFQVQQFWQVQFKYEPLSRISTEWSPLFVWMIQQRLIDFTPEITNPTFFYTGTLESLPADGKGLGFKMTEMLPQFPFLYDTGLMVFRRKVLS